MFLPFFYLILIKFNKKYFYLTCSLCINLKSSIHIILFFFFHQPYKIIFSQILFDTMIKICKIITIIIQILLPLSIHLHPRLVLVCFGGDGTDLFKLIHILCWKYYKIKILDKIFFYMSNSTNNKYYVIHGQMIK